MKLFKTKDELHKFIKIFLVIAASILFTVTIYKFNSIWAGLSKIFGLFTPFYIGFAIAYLLNPILVCFERKVFHKVKKKKTCRGLSITLVYIIFIFAIFLLLYFILPNLVSSISTLVNSIPDNMKILMKAIQNLSEQYPQINDLYVQYSDKLAGLITQTVETVLSALSSLLPSVVNVTVSITSGIANFFIGLVISIYMLLSKETLIAQIKKTLFAITTSQNAIKIIDIGKVCHEKMSNYLIGQLSISLADACIVYIVSLILDFPYPVLLAVIVGLFNMIPFFGSIIGCIPCVFIILIQSPIKALYFLVFFLILQQVEGNIIGPKIQGKQLNISAIWIIFAILLFGGLFGFFGLLIGVPLFSVMYLLISQAIHSALKNKGMSIDTEDYKNTEILIHKSEESTNPNN